MPCMFYKGSQNVGLSVIFKETEAVIDIFWNEIKKDLHRNRRRGNLYHEQESDTPQAVQYNTDICTGPTKTQ